MLCAAAWWRCSMHHPNHPRCYMNSPSRTMAAPKGFPPGALAAVSAHNLAELLLTRGQMAALAPVLHTVEGERFFSSERGGDRE